MKQGVDVVPFMLLEDAPWPRKFDELDTDPEVRTWREQLKKRHGVESFGLEPRSIDLTGTLGRWLTQNTSAQAEPQKHELIDWPDGKSPYPGLLWFDEDYAPLFFGRDREVDDLVDKMSEPEGRVLLVSGASGSGKSSLVAAGLWHAVINEGRLPGSQHWVWQRIQPSNGETPFHSLAQGLKQTFRGISRSAPELAKDLAGRQMTMGNFSLHTWLRGRNWSCLSTNWKSCSRVPFIARTYRMFWHSLWRLPNIGPIGCAWSPRCVVNLSHGLKSRSRFSKSSTPGTTITWVRYRRGRCRT